MLHVAQPLDFCIRDRPLVDVSQHFTQLPTFQTKAQVLLLPAPQHFWPRLAPLLWS